MRHTSSPVQPCLFSSFLIQALIGNFWVKGLNHQTDSFSFSGNTHLLFPSCFDVKIVLQKVTFNSPSKPWSCYNKTVTELQTDAQHNYDTNTDMKKVLVSSSSHFIILRGPSDNPWYFITDVYKDGQPVSTSSHCGKITLNYLGHQRWRHHVESAAVIWRCCQGMESSNVHPRVNESAVNHNVSPSLLEHQWLHV